MYNREQAAKATEKDIQMMEEVNKVLPAVKKLISSFDGKVINKRLDTALKDLGLPGYIYFCTHYETTFSILYKPAESNDYYTILNGTRPSCRYYVKEKSFVDEDKRISAERAYNLIEECRVERLKKITKYKEILQTYEEKKAQVELLKKQLRTIVDDVPYELRHRFDLEVKYY